MVMARKRPPQLLPPDELDRLIQAAQPGTECRLIEHIQAMCVNEDRHIDALQQVAFMASKPDGITDTDLKLKRIVQTARAALGGWHGA